MDKKILSASCLLAGIITFVAAAGGHPYSFYILTRWVVFVVCCWGALQNIENPKKWILIGFILIGIIFNPLIPFRFKRDVWQIIDIVSAITLVVFGYRNIQKGK
jgi:hypothetical protein